MKKMPKASPKKDRPGWFEAKGIDPDTGKRRSYLARTPQEASRLAHVSKSAARKPKHDGTLYGFYALVYLPTIAGHRHRTIEQIAWAWDGRILPAFGHVQIAELTRQEIQAQFNVWASELKGNSIRHLKTWFGAVLQLALDDGLIETNPVRRVRLPKIQTTKPNALDWPDLAALLEHACPTLRPAVYLMACGLSPSEACAVTRTTLKGTMLHVCQQVDQDRAEIVTTLKTDARYRYIPLPEWVAEELESSKERSKVLVCPNCDGYLMMPKSLTKLLAEACERAGIERVSPYQLRHTFISLIENDVEAPRRVVQALAGHARNTITDGYSHTFVRQLEKWMKAYWERVSMVVRQKEVSHEGQNAG